MFCARTCRRGEEADDPGGVGAHVGEDDALPRVHRRQQHDAVADRRDAQVDPRPLLRRGTRADQPRELLPFENFKI